MQTQQYSYTVARACHVLQYFGTETAQCIYATITSSSRWHLPGKMYSLYLTYSQVHKYWDIDTILIFLALYTTTMDLRCTRCALCADFNLRVFTSKSGERCRNYNSFYMRLPLFKGPKVMGQTNNHTSNFHFFNTWLQILCSQLQPEV